MNHLFIFLHLFFMARPVNQTDSTILPRVGQRCPDFYFEDLQYYEKKKVTLNDFKGRWLILDLWNRHCSLCVDRMPKMDSLQKKFSTNWTFIMVGYTGSRYFRRSENKEMHKLYPELKKRLNINLPVAYDSVMFHRFEIGPCPYLIIVDPSGIVRGVTTKVKEQNLKDLMEGKQPILEKATNRRGL